MTSLALALRTNAVRGLSRIQRAINILKSAGPGAWYDPSDLTTLFQDSAGTTPVTAVEQPVGLMLDKSRGLVLGPELVPYGNFADTSKWFNTPAYWTLGAGAAIYLNTSLDYIRPAAGYEVALMANKTYVLTFSISGATEGVNAARFSFTNLDGTATYTGIQRFTTNGAKTFIFTPAISTSNVRIYGYVGAGTWSIDNISVRELPGAHLIQPTATSRPTLSSRYNLLTKTEQFDDAVWLKSDSTITPNATTAPDGTATADTLVENTATSFHAATQLFSLNGLTTISCHIKAAGRIWAAIRTYDATNGDRVALFNLSTGALGTKSGGVTSSITPLADGWYRCAMTYTFLPASGSVGVTTHTSDLYTTHLGDGTSGIYVWGASLTTAADSSRPYQRVNTATDYDYDFSKFPPFLRFDGVDDSLYTAASVDFTSTDKMTVFAGVHKASDAAGGMLVEASAAMGSNVGSFNVYGEAGTGYWFQSRGTGAGASTAVSSGAAPLTSVLTGYSDIAGDVCAARRNGAFLTNTATDQGTGNYGNHVLYIGRRANASLPFSGRIYQLAIKGKSLSAGEVSTVESFVNSKTKAFV